MNSDPAMPVSSLGAGSALAHLIHIYESAGYQIRTGLNSYHWRGWRDAPFTMLFKDGKMLETGGGGISVQEAYFLENLRLASEFRHIFIIGNSFGWSTILMSLLWPKAQVRALDCGFLPPGDWAQALLERIWQVIAGEPDPFTLDPDFGLKLTNDLAANHGLNARAIKGTSPQHVNSVVEANFEGKPDLVFIDGYHTPHQVLLDFEAARTSSAPNCVFLFHDVVNWNLRGSFDRIQREHGLSGGILWRTTSGMGLLFPSTLEPNLRTVLNVFSERETLLRQLEERLWRRRLADTFKRAVLHSSTLRVLKRSFVGHK